MSNDEGMTKSECRKALSEPILHLSIRILLRHSCFVISLTRPFCVVADVRRRVSVFSLRPQLVRGSSAKPPRDRSLWSALFSPSVFLRSLFLRLPLSLRSLP